MNNNIKFRVELVEFKMNANLNFAYLELLSCKDQSLLIWGNPFLVLDFSLDILDRVRRLDLEGDGFPGQGFDENLHATTETEDQMEGGLLLDVVVGQCAPILSNYE